MEEYFRDQINSSKDMYIKWDDIKWWYLKEKGQEEYELKWVSTIDMPKFLEMHEFIVNENIKSKYLPLFQQKTK